MKFSVFFIYIFIFFSLIVSCENNLGKVDKEEPDKTGQTDPDIDITDPVDTDSHDPADDETGEEIVLIDNEDPDHKNPDTIIIDNEESEEDIPDPDTALDEAVIPETEEPPDLPPFDPCEHIVCGDNSHCETIQNNDGSDKPVCICDEGYHDNAGTCVSDTETTSTGDMTLLFIGPINPEGTGTRDLQAGKGTVDLTHFDDEFQFTQEDIFFGAIKFPQATTNGDRVTITWVYDPGFSSARFFSFFLNKTEEGDYTLPLEGNGAMYGDMSFGFNSPTEIDCIRSVASEGSYSIVYNKLGELELEGSATMIDPFKHVEDLGYEICSD